MPQILVPFALNAILGTAGALSLVLYGLAFSHVTRTPDLLYYVRLAFHPFFISAAGISLLMAAFVRTELFQSMGVQRAIYSAPIGGVITLLLTSVVFHNSMSPRQWAGAFIIMLGGWLLAGKG